MSQMLGRRRPLQPETPEPEESFGPQLIGGFQPAPVVVFQFFRPLQGYFEELPDSFGSTLVGGFAPPAAAPGSPWAPFWPLGQMNAQQAGAQMAAADEGMGSLIHPGRPGGGHVIKPPEIAPDGPVDDRWAWGGTL
jgi:hypothetical protein